MDGIETTQKIRQSNSAAQHIPIVAITANIGDKYSESYLSNGMNDSLIKPFGIESIEKKIADVFFKLQITIVGIVVHSIQFCYELT